MDFRLEQVVVDSAEPGRLVRFWAGLLGGEPVERDGGWAHVETPGGVRMAFQPVPERKDVKNRVHLDFVVEDIEAAVVKAVSLGAVREGVVVTDAKGSFQVMRDPEGNEFCFVR
ncbi:VOC family protein [Lentzea fradiae]|nr:VOC family protein [Lentzea fradiae]